MKTPPVVLLLVLVGCLSGCASDKIINFLSPGKIIEAPPPEKMGFLLKEYVGQSVEGVKSNYENKSRSGFVAERYVDCGPGFQLKKVAEKRLHRDFKRDSSYSGSLTNYSRLSPGAGPSRLALEDTPVDRLYYIHPAPHADGAVIYYPAGARETSNALLFAFDTTTGLIHYFHTGSEDIATLREMLTQPEWCRPTSASAQIER